MSKASAIIYNLFPRLLGNIEQWSSHFPRIRSMHFNWLFINPIQETGFSSSLYSIKDYFKLNPLFYDKSSPKDEREQIQDMLAKAHDNNLSVMLDLVINHTAIDHPLTDSNRNWYKIKDDKIVNPGAWDNGKWVSWGDLAEIDNSSSPDRDNLWNYWLSLALYYLDLGFDGFRCDAAYKVPGELWRMLISKCKEAYPKSKWFAESLGCPIEDTILLGKVGFDYTFNSVKWWDYKADWCIEQHNANKDYSSTISFPESHDTERLFSEYPNPVVIKHKYFFSAIFSRGLMIPIGFEFGFKSKLNVVKTKPSDYEDIGYDFSSYIREVNSLKSKVPILNEEGSISIISNEDSPPLLLKEVGKEKALILINDDFEDEASIKTRDIARPLGELSNSDKSLKLLSSIHLEHKDFVSVGARAEKETITLEPGEIILIYKD